MQRREYLLGAGAAVVAAVGAGCIVLPGGSGSESDPEDDTGGGSTTGDDTTAGDTTGGTGDTGGGGGGEDPLHRLAGDEGWLETDSEETRTSQTINARIEVESGYYVAWDLEPQRNVQYSCEWETEGNPMDVFLLDRREYDSRWRDADGIQYLSALSETDTSRGSVSGGIQAGEYVIVFSNSEQMATTPEGTVRADVSFTVSIE